jgi:dephospho-CoA kinase
MDLKKSNTPRRKLIVGLTGGFGSGKTTVASCIKTLGASVIDADAIAHALLKPGTRMYKKLLAVFGKGILTQGKEIDRKKLASLVFHDTQKLLKLDSIMHPEIVKRIKTSAQASRAAVVVIDAPLLIETGLHQFVDRVIVVTVNEKTQIQRIKDKTGLSKNEILQRIRRQIPLKE